MPTEMELCEIYKVSRTCLRQALNVLHKEKKIFSRQGSGSYVKGKLKAFDRVAIISVMYHGSIDVVRDVQQLILKNKCIMSLFSQVQRGWDPMMERGFLEQILQQKHRGLIASCTPIEPVNEDILADIQKNGTKVIHIEPYKAALPELNYLIPDYRRAGYAGAVHLMLKRYEEFYFLGPKPKVLSPYHALLKQGFEAAMSDHQKTFKYIDYKEFQNLFIKKKNNSKVGIFGIPYGKMLKAKEELILSGYEIPEQIGLMAIELAGDILNENDNIEYIYFDRMKILKKAVKQINKFPETSIQELFPPKISSSTKK